MEGDQSISGEVGWEETGWWWREGATKLRAEFRASAEGGVCRRAYLRIEEGWSPRTGADAVNTGVVEIEGIPGGNGWAPVEAVIDRANSGVGGGVSTSRPLWERSW